MSCHCQTPEQSISNHDITIRDNPMGILVMQMILSRFAFLLSTAGIFQFREILGSPRVNLF